MSAANLIRRKCLPRQHNDSFSWPSLLDASSKLNGSLAGAQRLRQPIRDSTSLGSVRENFPGIDPSRDSIAVLRTIGSYLNTC